MKHANYDPRAAAPVAKNLLELFNWLQAKRCGLNVSTAAFLEPSP